MDDATLLGRLGRFFRRHSDSDLPLADNGDNTGLQRVEASRGTFLRPWARRDQAIQNLQHGFDALTDLLQSVRDNLDRQSERQDELLEYLSHLPEALKALPESSRVQAETLKAIHQQLAAGNGQQTKLADILERLSNASAADKETLDELGGRLDDLSRHDQRISDTLGSVGTAMESVSTTSASSAQVLQQVRDNINSRDGQLERILLKQNTRFTTMLSIAIFLSITALAAVCVVGWLMYNRAG